MRTYVSPNFAGVRDPHIKRIARHFDTALAELSVAASQAVGGGGGTTSSGVITGPSADSSQATNFGRSLIGQDFVTINLDPTLINERALAVDEDSLTLSDAGSKGNVTIGVASPFKSNGLFVRTYPNDNVTAYAVEWETQGYENAPWRMYVQQGFGSGPSLDYDHVLITAYNGSWSKNGGVVKDNPNSHYVQWNYESRYTFAGDPLIDRGLFEWNLNIDPTTGSSVVTSTTRPWEFSYDMDNLVTRLTVGSTVDPQSGVFVMSAGYAFGSYADSVVFLDRETATDIDFGNRAQHGRFIIAPGGHIESDDWGGSITMTTSGDMFIRSGLDTDTVTPRTIFIGAASRDAQVVIGEDYFVSAKLYVVGHQDRPQLRVKGHSTQSNYLVLIEKSDGTDLFTVDNSGNGVFAGTLTFSGLFDATVPSDLASAAAAGSSTTAAHRDHVHRFPTSLMEYTNSKTLALSSTTTVSTLTVASGITDLDFATGGALVRIRPGATNTIALGSTARRFLAGHFGTSGLTNTGPYTQSGTSANTLTGNTTISGILVPSGGVSGSLSPVTDMSGAMLGDGTHRWDGAAVYQLYLGDSNIGPGTGNNFIIQATGSAATVDRTITYAYGDSDRTITFTGNPTLADWFNQSVKTTATPTFAGVLVGNSDIVPTVDLDAATTVGNTSFRFSAFYAQDFNMVDISTPTRVVTYRSNSSTTLSADRVLTLDVDNASRTLKFSGNPTLGDWFDQSVKTTAFVTHAGIYSTTTLDVDGNTVLGNATTDTIRLNAGGNASAPGTNAIGIIVDYYGTSATRVLTTPNRWQSIIGDDGNTYKIPLYS